MPPLTDTARTLLFVPGNRPERFDKAAGAGADLVVVDLEDAVAPDEKEPARRLALAWSGITRAVVRINAAGTDWHEGDLDGISAAGRTGPVAVMLAKADAASVASVARRLPADVPILALVETALGIRDAFALAEIPAVTRLVFGSIDYSLDLGIVPTPPAEDELLLARSTLVLASKAAGIAAPIDGVTRDLDDLELVERDARRAKNLGFGGKLCIHPRQLAATRTGFAPSEAEVARARLIVAASTDGAAARLGGEMIDAPVLSQALRILAEVDAAQGPTS